MSREEIVMDPDATLSTARSLAASPAAVFAAFAQADALARWWGPAGFTNTFVRFEFEPGGQWVFTMHGPDGTDYHNESVFREIVPDQRIVIEHIVPPHFTLTVTLSARGEATFLTWDQAFDNAEMAARVSAIAGPANEQNLDRLSAVLAGA